MRTRCVRSFTRSLDAHITTEKHRRRMNGATWHRMPVPPIPGCCDCAQITVISSVNFRWLSVQVTKRPMAPASNAYQSFHCVRASERARIHTPLACLAHWIVIWLDKPPANVVAATEFHRTYECLLLTGANVSFHMSNRYEMGNKPPPDDLIRISVARTNATCLLPRISL